MGDLYNKSQSKAKPYSTLFDHVESLSSVISEHVPADIKADLVDVNQPIV